MRKKIALETLFSTRWSILQLLVCLSLQLIILDILDLGTLINLSDIEVLTYPMSVSI